MGCGLTLGSEVRGQNQLLHFAIQCAVKQLLQTNVVWPYAVQRIEFTHQDKVQTFIGTGALQR